MNFRVFLGLLLVVPTVLFAQEATPVTPADTHERPTVTTAPAPTTQERTEAAESTQAIKEDALVLFRQGNYERSIQVCLAELDSPSRSRIQKLDSYVVLCWSLYKAGRYRDAVRYAQEGLKINMSDARLLFTQSEAYFSLKDYVNALDSLETYVKVAPTGDKLAQVYNLMGTIFLQWGENHHAATAFSTSINIDPNVSAVWVHLGEAKEKIKDIKGAKEAYRRALGLQNYNEEAKAGMERIEKLGAGR